MSQSPFFFSHQAVTGIFECYTTLFFFCLSFIPIYVQITKKAVCCFTLSLSLTQPLPHTSAKQSPMLHLISFYSTEHTDKRIVCKCCMVKPLLPGLSLNWPTGRNKETNSVSLSHLFLSPEHVHHASLWGAPGTLRDLHMHAALLSFAFISPRIRYSGEG